MKLITYQKFFLHILDTGKIDKYVTVLCLILIC